MKTYTAKNGTAFSYRIIKKGDHYGLNDCLISEEDRPSIEFYDQGQFVSSYYIKTLLPHLADRTGINLQGGVESWQIDAKTLRSLLEDAINEVMNAN